MFYLLPRFRNKVSLGVVDIDGFPVETHGDQSGAAYNG
jgi:hypothetical protein